MGIGKPSIGGQRVVQELIFDENRFQELGEVEALSPCVAASPEAAK